MPDIIGAGQDRRMHQHVGLIARLRVVELRADMKPDGAPGQLIFTRQRAHQIHHLRGLGRAAHRRARLHVDRDHELPIDMRRPGRTSCVKARPASASALTCATAPTDEAEVDAPHKREGREDHRLIMARIDLHRIEHGDVPDQRRVAVGDRHERPGCRARTPRRTRCRPSPSRPRRAPSPSRCP